VNEEAIPALAFGAITTLAGIWKLLDFVRDKRVKLAESDVVDVRKRLIQSLEENEQLRVRIATLQAQSGAQAKPLT
jgi:hypothetical protein